MLEKVPSIFCSPGFCYSLGCPFSLPGVLSWDHCPRSFWATLPMTVEDKMQLLWCYQVHPYKYWFLDAAMCTSHPWFCSCTLKKQDPTVHKTDKWHFCPPSKKHFLNSLRTLSCFPIFLLHVCFFFSVEHVFHVVHCQAGVFLCILIPFSFPIPDSLSIHHHFTNLCSFLITAPVLIFLLNTSTVEDSHSSDKFCLCVCSKWASGCFSM